VEGVEALRRALPAPRSLWHRSIYLLKVELVLDYVFINVGDHVGRLDEGHREAGAHPESETSFAFGL